MEIEAKYRVASALTPERIGALDLHPYTLRQGKDERHHDSVLDTADRAITGGGYALRIRTVGARRTLTLKGPQQGVGGLHSREETEASLPETSAQERGAKVIDRADWPEPIATHVRELIGDEPVRKLLHDDIHRRTWIVERAGQEIAELAYDVGTISAGRRSDEVNELEVELKGAGVLADLHALDDLLRAALDLEPETRTKLARGLFLLGRQRPSPGHRDLRALGRRTIHEALRKYDKREPDARAGDDPEGVHDVRVAIRRLRSTLALLEDAPGFPASDLRRWRKRLKRVASALGETRDLDVQLGRLAEYLERRPHERAGLESIQRQMTHDRERARATMLDALDARKTQDGLRALERFATPQDPLGHEASADDLVLVRGFASGAIWRRYEEVLRFECALPTESALTLHELRIACKRLRYALEMFERALGPDARPLIAALVATQDCLGAHQDTVVARHLIGRAPSDGGKNASLQRYDDALQEEQVALREHFRRLWVRLSGTPFRRDLASLIAAL